MPCICDSYLENDSYSISEKEGAGVLVINTELGIYLKMNAIFVDIELGGRSKFPFPTRLVSAYVCMYVCISNS